MSGTILITKEMVLLDLEASSKHDVIHTLCGHLFLEKRTSDPALLYQDIIRREELVSTFAGSRMAIPHALTEHVSEASLIFARLKDEELTWDGADETVRFVFLLVAPAAGDLKQQRQQQSAVFSAIAQLMSDSEMWKLWETTDDRKEILDCLQQCIRAC